MLPVGPDVQGKLRPKQLWGSLEKLHLSSLSEYWELLVILFEYSWWCNIDIWANVLPRRVIADSTAYPTWSIVISLLSLLNLSNIPRSQARILVDTLGVLQVLCHHNLILSSSGVFITATFGSAKKSASQSIPFFVLYTLEATHQMLLCTLSDFHELP